MTQILHLAEIIITNDKEPVMEGGLLVEDSKIVKVGKREDFGELTDTHTKIIDHGKAIICPGFINLHTHLLYSKIKHINGSNGLFPWLESLVDTVSIWDESDYINSINYGINEAISCGTTFIVENTPNLLSAELLLKSPLKGIIGLEVFGSDEEKASEIFNQALRNLFLLNAQCPALNAKKLDFTFSPHAPYDVSANLWKELIGWSEKNNKPLLTHLEESPDEKLWWNEKEGRGVNFWKKIKKLDSKLKYWEKYNSGINFLLKNRLLTNSIIATHLCEANKDDLETLKRHNIKLVHCPRSNYYLNNRTVNLKLWDELGFIWGIGTDSIASNENLDLLEELRFTINQQNIVYNNKIPTKNAFQKITSDAAKTISKENQIGYLKPGYYADFLVYDIKEKPACTYHDPYHLVVFELTKKDLKEVWINSQRAWIQEEILHKI